MRAANRDRNLFAERAGARGKTRGHPALTGSSARGGRPARSESDPSLVVPARSIDRDRNRLSVIERAGHEILEEQIGRFWIVARKASPGEPERSHVALLVTAGVVREPVSRDAVSRDAVS